MRPQNIEGPDGKREYADDIDVCRPTAVGLWMRHAPSAMQQQSAKGQCNHDVECELPGKQIIPVDLSQSSDVSEYWRKQDEVMPCQHQAKANADKDNPDGA